MNISYNFITNARSSINLSAPRTLLSAALILLMLLCAWERPASSLSEATRDQLTVFAEALGIVEDNHVDPKETKKQLRSRSLNFKQSPENYLRFLVAKASEK